MNKRAIVSCITDNFIGLGAVFVASLVETKTLSEGTDLILLEDETYAHISDENKRLIERIWPQVMWRMVDSSFLNEDLIKRYNSKSEIVKADRDEKLKHKKAVYLKLDVFRLTQYERVMWMDSDTLAIHRVDELFRAPAQFAAVPTGNPAIPHFGIDFVKGRKPFNTGLFVVRKDLLGDESFNRLVEMLEEKQHTDVQDQSLLINFMDGKNKLLLPHCYNWKMTEEFSPEEDARTMTQARLIHFVAKAKWRLVEDRPWSKVCAAFHTLRFKYEIPLTISK